MPAADDILELIGTVAPAAGVVIKTLRSVVDLVASLVGDGPTQPQLAELLRREAERLYVLAERVDAAQAKDHDILNGRIPPKKP